MNINMTTTDMIQTGLGVALLIFCIIRCFKEKELAKRMINLLIISAEEHYLQGEGKDKLTYVLQHVRMRLPKWCSWMLSDKIIKGVIETALGKLQPTFRGVFPSVEKGEIGLRANRIYESANHTTELYAEGTTNLKGDNRVTAGVKIKL